MKSFFKYVLLFISSIAFSRVPLNCPYKNINPNDSVSYQFISSYPDNLDPILIYDTERNFMSSQIYEPLYSIEFKTKPYHIIPHIAAKMPMINFFDKNHHPVTINDNIPIKTTEYTISLRKQIYYQPHPGFCKILAIKNCNHFKREVKAQDYAYQIKRIAQLDSKSPFASILAKFIVGFKDYQKSQKHSSRVWRDLSSDIIQGIKVIDDYTLKIITKGYSNQWIYWLTMNFLSPMPWEIDKYQQVILKDKRMLNYSIGSGPYMLFNNNSKQEIELKQNPNYREEYYLFPDGLKKIPIVERFIISVEKEIIPRWNKFLQGYYDISNIPSESFQNTIQVNQEGKIAISKAFEQQNIRLKIQESPYVSGIVFNFMNPIVGGYSSNARKLRQALSIAFDFDEYRTVFRSGRGQLAYDPIPPAVLANKDLIITGNPILYKHHVKKSLHQAKRLLAEAGYPNGINPKTNKPLVLTLDQVSEGLPEEKALFSWFRKQINKLGIQLNIRENDTNRYYKRLLNADYQLTFFIWSADFPTVENFLMLFYGPNHYAKAGGPNWSNFNHKEYNDLFKKLEVLPDGDIKNNLVKKMVHILQTQAVWVWGNYGESFSMMHEWIDAPFYQDYGIGYLKYYRINVEKRLKIWKQWNAPHWVPIILVILIFLILIFPFWLEQQKMKHAKACRTKF